MSGPVTLAVMLVAYRRWRSEVTAGDPPLIDVISAALETADPAVFVDDIVANNPFGCTACQSG